MSKPQYVVVDSGCQVQHVDGTTGDPEEPKIYRTLSDREAESHKMLRIVDEDKSEPEGYLYPQPMFVPIELPEVVKRVLAAKASQKEGS